MIELGYHSPWDPLKPHYKAQEYLSIDRSKPGKTRSHLVSGRGGGKTATGILLAIDAAFVKMPGLVGIWTEPTGRDCEDIFIPEWEKAVPSHMYHLTRTPGKIKVHCCNGSTIFVRSRFVDNKQKETTKGVNASWGIDDEAAQKFDRKKWIDIDGAIRVPSPFMFHDTMSTPKMNEYYNLIFDKDGAVREGHNYVHMTSYDNPYLIEEYASDLAVEVEAMSPEYRDQEVLGQWVSQSGKIWRNFSDKAWPNGNIHYHAHDYSRPYYLFFDIGVASSAWLVVQQVAPTDELGRAISRYENEPVWVVTAEYMPKRDGAVGTVLPKMKQEFGTPIKVICGHDVSTRGSQTSTTPLVIVNEFFGSVPVDPIGKAGDHRSDKELQHMQLSYGILDTKDRRRFCVSKDLKRMNDTNRGVLQVMRQDVWADEKGANAMPKEGRLEHCRDAILYGGQMMFPAHFGKHSAHAA